MARDENEMKRWRWESTTLLCGIAEQVCMEIGYLGKRATMPQERQLVWKALA